MSKSIAVLGTGLIGSHIARTFAKEGYQTIAFDNNEQALASLGEIRGLETRRADLTKKLYDEILDADVVVGALPPSNIAFQVFCELMKAGKKYVDISFMEEDFRQVEPIIEKNGGTSIPDFGVAPGMTNFFVGQANSILGPENHRSSIIHVCGLPLNEQRGYFAPFGSDTVCEEYERLARYKQGGVIKEEIPFMREELVSINGKRLPSFLNDGLRSMLYTLPGVSEIAEWTPRYRAHFDEMRRIKETTGFTQEVKRRLCKEWRMRKEDRDFTYARVKSIGEDGIVVTQTLYDEFDEESGVHSMARTTGYPAVIMAKMIADGEIDFGEGIFYPEKVAQRDDVSKKVISSLRAYGISIKIEIK